MVHFDPRYPVYFTPEQLWVVGRKEALCAFELLFTDPHEAAEYASELAGYEAENADFIPGAVTTSEYVVMTVLEAVQHNIQVTQATQTK